MTKEFNEFKEDFIKEINSLKNDEKEYYKFIDNTNAILKDYHIPLLKEKGEDYFIKYFNHEDVLKAFEKVEHKDLFYLELHSPFLKTKNFKKYNKENLRRR